MLRKPRSIPAVINAGIRSGRVCDTATECVAEKKSKKEEGGAEEPNWFDVAPQVISS